MASLTGGPLETLRRKVRAVYVSLPCSCPRKVFKSIYGQQETVSYFGEFAMNGIEQLRAFILSGQRIGIAVSLAFQLVEVGDGFAAFEGVPGLHAYNPLGTVHGGYAATLLDSACGCAVHSKLSAGDSYTTLELKIAYHKAMSEKTGKVHAEGRVLTFGRRVAFSEGKLLDNDGRLLASATSTLLVIPSQGITQELGDETRNSGS
jgi:uncharacterized protein (TIGR00369 family)